MSYELNLMPDYYSVSIDDNLVRDGSLVTDFSESTELEYIVDQFATKPSDWND